jgi:hypothetical protein
MNDSFLLFKRRHRTGGIPMKGFLNSVKGGEPFALGYSPADVDGDRLMFFRL